MLALEPAAVCPCPGPMAGGRWLVLAAGRPLWGPEIHSSSCALEGTTGGEVLDLEQVLPGPHFAHLQMGGASFGVLFQFIWSLNAASL